MTTEPVIEHRGAKNYVAIETRVHMNEIPAVLPALIPKVYAWLNDRSIPAAGAPFFRYLAMNEKHELDVEVGVPVEQATQGDGEINAGFFTEGSYGVMTYTGDYKFMREAHMKLDAWLKQHGWREHFQVTSTHPKLGARTEFYINDPKVETDPAKWITEIVMLVTPAKEAV